MKRTNFNENWLFYAQGQEAKAIRLPHDAMIHERRQPDAPSGSAQGFFCTGAYAYEKTFSLSRQQTQGHILFQFEGV